MARPYTCNQCHKQKVATNRGTLPKRCPECRDGGVTARERRAAESLADRPPTKPTPILGLAPRPHDDVVAEARKTLATFGALIDRLKKHRAKLAGDIEAIDLAIQELTAASMTSAPPAAPCIRCRKPTADGRVCNPCRAELDRVATARPGDQVEA